MTVGITINGLEKRLRDFSLGPIDAEIPAGNITAIIGGNSSGKTTLIKCISGSYDASSGSVEYSKPVSEGNIGIVSDSCPFPAYLNPMGLSKVMSSIFSDWDPSKYIQLCVFLGIDLDRKIAQMSKGRRIGLQVAVSMSHRTEYLLMDEPTSGLDPISRGKVLDLVREYVSDGGHTAVIASHDTSFLDVNADYALLLDGGEQLLFDDMNSISNEYGCVSFKTEEIPRSFIIGEELGKYGRTVFIRDREELSKRFPEMGIDSICLDDLVANCKGLKG